LRQPEKEKRAFQAACPLHSRPMFNHFMQKVILLPRNALFR